MTTYLSSCSPAAEMKREAFLLFHASQRHLQKKKPEALLCRSPSNQQAVPLLHRTSCKPRGPPSTLQHSHRGRSHSGSSLISCRLSAGNADGFLSQRVKTVLTLHRGARAESARAGGSPTPRWRVEMEVEVEVMERAWRSTDFSCMYIHKNQRWMTWSSGWANYLCECCDVRKERKSVECLMRCNKDKNRINYEISCGRRRQFTWSAGLLMGGAGLLSVRATCEYLGMLLRPARRKWAKLII